MEKKVITLLAALLCVGALFFLFNSKGAASSSYKLVLGNIVTMDWGNPAAEAMAIKDGIIEFVGDRETALGICGKHPVVEYYGKATVYPYFYESFPDGPVIDSCKTSVPSLQQWVRFHLQEGLAANYIVYDRDFLREGFESINNANLICIVVNGEKVYSNE